MLCSLLCVYFTAHRSTLHSIFLKPTTSRYRISFQKQHIALWTYTYIVHFQATMFHYIFEKKNLIVHSLALSKPLVGGKSSSTQQISWRAVSGNMHLCNRGIFMGDWLVEHISQCHWNNAVEVLLLNSFLLGGGVPILLLGSLVMHQA